MEESTMFFMPYMGQVDHAAIQEFLHNEGVPCHIPDCGACFNANLTRDPEVSAITSSRLLETACTLRERVFARLFSMVSSTTKKNKLEIRLHSVTLSRAPGKPGTIIGEITRPKELTARGIMRACLRNVSL